MQWCKSPTHILEIFCGLFLGMVTLYAFFVLLQCIQIVNTIFPYFSLDFFMDYYYMAELKKKLPTLCITDKSGVSHHFLLLRTIQYPQLMSATITNPQTTFSHPDHNYLGTENPTIQFLSFKYIYSDQILNLYNL